MLHRDHGGGLVDVVGNDDERQVQVARANDFECALGAELGQMVIADDRVRRRLVELRKVFGLGLHARERKGEGRVLEGVAQQGGIVERVLHMQQAIGGHRSSSDSLM
jgi:hypothetical protein